MSDLLDTSARILEGGAFDRSALGAQNGELGEVGDGIAVVDSFSNAVIFDTGDGLVTVDISHANSGVRVTEAIRGWRTDPVDTLVYTHGHIDHVGGSGALLADGDARGHARPRVVAHEAVADRFARYRQTNAWNNLINARQFGGTRNARKLEMTSEADFLPLDVAEPTDTYEGTTTFTVGDTEFIGHHARGETDDHTWLWVPSHRAICPGDLFLWVFPNAGNPQKVQRYPSEWAAALRAMAALEPELMLPAHGLPVGGVDRIGEMLHTVADVLVDLEERVVAMMNAGASLNEIVHTVAVDPELLALPYLRPTYDEPSFLVRNVWRLYGGWWDADPAHLHPAPAAELGQAVAALAGGAVALARAAEAEAETGRLDVACQLVEYAAQSLTADAPAADRSAVHGIRAELYGRRRGESTSLMAKGMYTAAVRESEAELGTEADPA